MAGRIVFGIGFVHGDNILIAVAVNIAHDEPIAATECETGYLWIVDNVFLPTYITSVIGAGAGLGLTDEFLCQHRGSKRA